MTRREPTVLEIIFILIFSILYYFSNDYITNYFLTMQTKILGGKNQILTSPGFFSYRLVGLIILFFIVNDVAIRSIAQLIGNLSSHPQFLFFISTKFDIVSSLQKISDNSDQLGL